MKQNAIKKSRASKHITRLVIPDSHGAHIDPAARDAMLGDIRRMQVDQVVWLGDHLDAGGVFSTHQRAYTKEIAESFADDCDAANEFLDLVQEAAPNAQHHYIEGNHEAHLERWASRTFQHKVDADRYLDKQGPAAILRLRQRGFRYYRTSDTYCGLPTPGVIKLGNVHFSHGWSFGKNATADHLASAGVSIIHGHTHTSQASMARNMSSGAVGAWCPGSLCKLQPLYRHNSPTRWTHGYILQVENQSSKKYMTLQVPIIRGESMLHAVQGMLAPRSRKAA